MALTKVSKMRQILSFIFKSVKPNLEKKTYELMVLHKIKKKWKLAKFHNSIWYKWLISFTFIEYHNFAHLLLPTKFFCSILVSFEFWKFWFHNKIRTVKDKNVNITVTQEALLKSEFKKVSINFFLTKKGFFPPLSIFNTLRRFSAKGCTQSLALKTWLTLSSTCCDLGSLQLLLPGPKMLHRQLMSSSAMALGRAAPRHSTWRHSAEQYSALYA